MVVVGDCCGVLFGFVDCCRACVLSFDVVVMLCVVCVFGSLLSCCVVVFVVCCFMLFDL